MTRPPDEVRKVRIYVMGKKYEVPEGLTIMKAMEYIGYKFIRGAGCRGGFCGACATIYRMEGDYRLQVALACQELVRDGMYLTMIPFAPAKKKTYDIRKLRPTPNVFLQLYPEIARCLSCNTCTRACPQDIPVMDYVQAALRGDIKEAAELSFDCIACGLCAVRCPAGIVPYYVGLLARRLYGKYMLPKSEELKRRVEEIRSGVFDAELDKLVRMNVDELKRLYEMRVVKR